MFICIAQVKQESVRPLKITSPSVLEAGNIQAISLRLGAQMTEAEAQQVGQRRNSDEDHENNNNNKVTSSQDGGCAITVSKLDGADVHVQVWVLITAVHPQLRAFASSGESVVTWRRRTNVLHTTSLSGFAAGLDAQDNSATNGEDDDDDTNPEATGSKDEAGKGSSRKDGRGTALCREVLHAARQVCRRRDIC